jgi:hypothetical protein
MDLDTYWTVVLKRKFTRNLRELDLGLLFSYLAMILLIKDETGSAA